MNAHPPPADDKPVFTRTRIDDFVVVVTTIRAFHKTDSLLFRIRPETNLDYNRNWLLTQTWLAALGQDLLLVRES